MVSQEWAAAADHRLGSQTYSMGPLRSSTSVRFFPLATTITEADCGRRTDSASTPGRPPRLMTTPVASGRRATRFETRARLGAKEPGIPGGASVPCIRGAPNFYSWMDRCTSSIRISATLPISIWEAGTIIIPLVTFEAGNCELFSPDAALFGRVGCRHFCSIMQRAPQ